MTATPDRTVLRWLLLLWLGVGGMLVLGGTVRLTGSGLSMTDWRPITGALPPLTDQAWAEEFARYLASPEGRLVNGWMALEDFRRIFFWEWAHRVAGRLLGLMVAVPWGVFLASGRLRGRLAWAVFGVFLLGAAQGGMGWFMVSSGLVDRPHVDHLRLAAHLLLALVLTVALLRLTLTQVERPAGHPGLHRAAGILVLLILVQCGFGAFVAGTHAGHVYPTWPGYGGAWPPPEALALTPWWRNVLDNPAGMHFVHRTVAWGVAAAVLLWSARAWRQGLRRLPLLLLGLVVAQIGLGVATVLLRVPVGVAVLHQACAWLLLSATTLASWATGGLPCPSDSRPSSSPSASRASSRSASPRGRSGRSTWPRLAGTSSRSTAGTS